MPKPKGKGGKNRKRGKNDTETDKRELIFKEDGQDYAVVEKMLGNGWLGCICADGQPRNAHIRGAFRKKIWFTLNLSRIGVGDVLLLSLRDFQDVKADVILKYSGDEARLLKSYGELAENLKINETETAEGTTKDGDGDDEIEVEFDIDEI